MRDSHRSLTSYLLQRQWRRPGRAATLVHLAAHPALLLLVFADGGVVHHCQVRVLAISQTQEDVLGEKKKQGGKGRFFFKGFPHIYLSASQ